jgi:hypothetical protein
MICKLTERATGAFAAVMAVRTGIRKQTGNRNTLGKNTGTGRTVGARIRNVFRTDHLSKHGFHIRRAACRNRTALTDLSGADGDLRSNQTGHVAGGIRRQRRKGEFVSGPTDC